MAGRCHLCGSRVLERWTADHVLAHARGGQHAVDNYLPAHVLCNGYKWSYGAEEFQWALKIGVWARLQMEKRSALGEAMLRGFFVYDRRREGSDACVPRTPYRHGSPRKHLVDNARVGAWAQHYR
jgi:HNH endonuclease